MFSTQTAVYQPAEDRTAALQPCPAQWGLERQLPQAHRQRTRLAGGGWDTSGTQIDRQTDKERPTHNTLRVTTYRQRSTRESETQRKGPRWTDPRWEGRGGARQSEQTDAHSNVHTHSARGRQTDNEKRVTGNGTDQD